jgi:hypothetical protein
MARPKSKKTLIQKSLEELRKSVEESATSGDSLISGIPSIIDFVESPEYLGLPHYDPTPVNLYPLQKIVLKIFYRGSIGNEDLKLTKEELDIVQDCGLNCDDNGDLKEKFDNGSLFRELILVWGRRSGKDFVISILALYEAMKLLEAPKGDPYSLYNLGPGAPFTILTVANSSTQAQILFREIKDKMLRSPYFANKISSSGMNQDSISLLTPVDKIRNEEFKKRGLPYSPGSVEIRCGHSNSDTLAGIGCFCLLLDEIGLYKQTAGASGGDAIFRTLTPAVATYVRKENVKDDNGNDVIDDDGNVVQKDMYDGKIICISSPRSKEGIFYELYRHSPDVKHRLMCRMPTWKVNINHTEESLHNLFPEMTEEEFSMEFGAMFSGMAGQTFFSRDMVEIAFKNNLKLKSNGEPNSKYFMHLDPATSSHNYALTICHKERFINDKTGKMDWKVVLDHVKYWTPTPGKPIINKEVEDYILSISRRFYLSLVTFDQWNSTESINRLREYGIPAKMTRFTKRYKIIIYDNLYNLISANKIDIPHHELLKNEMLYLQRRYLPTGYRVFAKKDGLVRTDDLVDSLAGAAYMAIEEESNGLPKGRLVRFDVNTNNNQVWNGMQGPLGVGPGSRVSNELNRKSPRGF